jgi:alpha-galactosidase
MIRWAMGVAIGFAMVGWLGVAASGAPQKSGVLAATPPMGWNSWDAYGLTITEAQFRANVEVLAKRLKPAGYEYAVIDEGWFMRNPQDRPKPELLEYELDAYGRYIPVPARFASAVNASGGNDGFKALGAYVHGLGLKFGIHIVRGIPRESVKRNLPLEGSSFKAVDVADQEDACPWDPTNWGIRNDAAGQAWYDSLMRQYAGWGVDLIKVDCIASHPYKADEIAMIHKAIVKTGRPMVLSLSPGPTALENAAEVGGMAQMWRISDDIWDVWTSNEKWPRTVKSQFEMTAAWVKFVKPGNWPDADMLPVGVLGPSPGWGKARSTRLTRDEQRTLLTLWAMARAPLIVGANLTEMDDWTAGLLTNADVVAMDQRGHEQHVAGGDGDLIAWATKGDGGKEYLAVFNTGDAQARVAVPLGRYGFKGDKYAARDVWEGKDLGKVSEAAGVVAAHGVLLLELKK